MKTLIFVIGTVVALGTCLANAESSSSSSSSESGSRSGWGSGSASDEVSFMRTRVGGAPPAWFGKKQIGPSLTCKGKIILLCDESGGESGNENGPESTTESGEIVEPLPIAIPDTKPGGLGPEKEEDGNIRKIVNQLQKNIEKETCKVLKMTPRSGRRPLKIHKYREQAVGGINYFVSLDAHKKTFHVKIYEELGTKSLKLMGAKGPKKSTDRIEYF